MVESMIYPEASISWGAGVLPSFAGAVSSLTFDGAPLAAFSFEPFAITFEPGGDFDLWGADGAILWDAQGEPLQGAPQ